MGSGAPRQRGGDAAADCVRPAAVASPTMRIFVTGASGFIGQVLCERLLAGGNQVSALTRRPGSEPRGTRPVAGDLADGVRLGKALAAERPDCVIHLAAEIASQRDARKVHAVNVDGTARLIEACLGSAGADASAGPAPTRAPARGWYSPRPSSPEMPTASCSQRTRRCRSRRPTGAPSRRASVWCSTADCLPS